jgi:signal transduction histidine kinase
MNRTVSILFSGALLVFFALYTHAFPRSPVVWVGAAIIMLIYLTMVWAPQRWWTRTKYIASVCLVLAIAIALAPINGKNAADPYLLFPLVLLLAKEQHHYRRIATVLAAVTLVVFFVFALPSTGAFIWEGGVIALYFSVRAINIYKVAHRLSESRLQALDQAHQELQKVHAELQEARLHSMRYAALVERTRLAQEVHDGLGHQLTSLIVQLQALEIMLPGDPERAAAAVPAMLDAARKAMAEVRLAVREWRDDESGLGLVAVQGLVWQTAARSQLALDFEQEGSISDWSTDLSVAIYRTVQEALTNIMRHAHATAATVKVEERAGQVTLTISDDGHYTADTPLSPGFGLQGIMERARAFGGSYTLSPNQPHGLTLQVAFPLRMPAGPGVASPSTSQVAHDALLASPR